MGYTDRTDTVMAPGNISDPDSILELWGPPHTRLGDIDFELTDAPVLLCLLY